jgi:DNA-binding CsgD family transcriptional regulator
VEVLLTSGDVVGARSAAEELSEHAAALDAPLLRAVADRARGAVCLAEGEPRAALDALRAAWDAWKALEAPYAAARTRLLVGRACRDLGDENGAELEIEAAARTFRDLGAGPDLARAERLLGNGHPQKGHGLTSREMEVLEHVAAGETNREIGARLSISERTVERHLTNIYRKLRVSSRAAATAYAYEHDLL